jgi:hypothetical protein
MRPNWQCLLGRYLLRSGVMEEERLSVSEAVQRLRALKQDHLDISKYMMKDVFFAMDFLAVATLNRSLCLIAGFCTLIESKNMVAAAPLFRMQLDNCLRFSAAWIVENPHHFATRILEGVPIRKMRDQAGNLMTDKHLVEMLSAEYPWMKSTYEQSSGYVHLSEKHMFNCIRIKPQTERTISMKISDVDEFIPDPIYLEVVEAFSEATKVVLKFAYGWAFTKNNPEAVAEMKRRRVRKDVGSDGTESQ